MNPMAMGQGDGLQVHHLEEARALGQSKGQMRHEGLGVLVDDLQEGYKRKEYQGLGGVPRLGPGPQGERGSLPGPHGARPPITPFPSI